MLQGGYPRIYDTRMPLNLFFSNYIDTYIERDVSEYLDVRNLADFRRFLTLCALSSGALINYTNIANELGVSPRTVKAWMSILESSYIAFHLMPFYTNARKQVVKTPKLYFMTLACCVISWAFGRSKHWLRIPSSAIYLKTSSLRKP